MAKAIPYQIDRAMFKLSCKVGNEKLTIDPGRNTIEYKNGEQNVIFRIKHVSLIVDNLDDITFGISYRHYWTQIYNEIFYELKTDFDDFIKHDIIEIFTVFSTWTIGHLYAFIKNSKDISTIAKDFLFEKYKIDVSR